MAEVRVNQIIKALDSIEQWCKSIRMVMESMPADQVLMTEPTERGGTPPPPSDGGGGLAVIKGCPPPSAVE